MKVGILAGGLGTRLQEETTTKPKPMVEFGGRPMLWHIMNNYAAAGFNEFVIALGYKGDDIKNYFFNYYHCSKNLTIKLRTGEVTIHNGLCEDWTVHLLDTGLETQTGGRVKHIAEFIGNEAFMLTYGDGIANVDLQKLLAFHKKHGRLATLTAVRPPARFGAIVYEGDTVTGFAEKLRTGEGWVNGGFFVFEPGAVDYIVSDSMHLEREPLERLAEDGQLRAYKHEGFWQCMDTMRDVRYLEELCQSGNRPWLSKKDGPDIHILSTRTCVSGSIVSATHIVSEPF